MKKKSLTTIILAILLCGLVTVAFATMHCPKCGRTFPDTDEKGEPYEYCTDDGTKLIKVQPKPKPKPKPKPQIQPSIDIRDGKLILASVPSGASVYVDGYYKGTTPLTITTLDPGTYTVKLSKSGYRSYERTVTIPQVSGSLQVNSTPSGASIYLDGEYTGYSTPRLFNDVSLGSHTVKLAKSGYKSISKTAYVSAGSSSTVEATLYSGSEKYGKSWPLILHEDFDDGRANGWKIEGTPTVKNGYYVFDGNDMAFLPDNTRCYNFLCEFRVYPSGQFHYGELFLIFFRFGESDGDMLAFIPRWQKFSFGNNEVADLKEDIRNQWNTVAVVGAGSEISFYLNGSRLKSVTDYSARGDFIGLRCSLTSSTVYFDDVKVWAK